MFTKYRPLDNVQSDVVLNMYDTLAYLLCDGSILEPGHGDTCYIPNVNTALTSVLATQY